MTASALPDQDRSAFGAALSASADPVALLNSWLRTALDAYFSGDGNPWAFRPFEYDIGSRDDDLASRLVTVYRGRPVEEQAHWRQTVCELLAEHGADPSWWDPVDTLIDLATRMPAHQVLDVLPSLIRGTDEHAARRTDRVISAADALASQTPRSIRCLKCMRSTSPFPTHHAGDLVATLCRIDPDCWVDHMVHMEPAMRRFEKQSKSPAMMKRHYASRVLRAVTIERVASDLGRLVCSMSEHFDRHLSWFYEAMLFGPEPLVLLDRPYLVLREDPAVRGRLDEGGAVELASVPRSALVSGRPDGRASGESSSLRGTRILMVAWYSRPRAGKSYSLDDSPSRVAMESMVA